MGCSLSDPWLKVIARVHPQKKYERRKNIFRWLYDHTNCDLDYLDFVLNIFDSHCIGSENGLYSIRANRLNKKYYGKAVAQSRRRFQKCREALQEVRSSQDDSPSLVFDKFDCLSEPAVNFMGAADVLGILCGPKEIKDRLIFEALQSRKKMKSRKKKQDRERRRDARDDVCLAVQIINAYLSKCKIKKAGILTYLLAECIFFPWEIISNKQAQKIWPLTEPPKEPNWWLKATKHNTRIIENIQKRMNDFLSDEAHFSKVVKHFPQLYIPQTPPI